VTTSTKDAKALLAVRLGDGQPLVPTEAQGQGARAVVAAALKRLADLKRPRAPIVYRSEDSAQPKACSGAVHNTEVET
jgi:hypothetical protein